MSWNTQKHTIIIESVIIFQNWVMKFCLHLDISRGVIYSSNIWNKKGGHRARFCAIVHEGTNIDFKYIFPREDWGKFHSH